MVFSTEPLPIDTFVVEFGTRRASINLAPKGDAAEAYILGTNTGTANLFLNGQAVNVGQTLTVAEMRSLAFGDASGPHSVSLQFYRDNGHDFDIYNAVILVGPSLNGAYIGTSKRDVLDGGAGHDFINGLAGADLMVGGTGNDQFVVDNRGDVASEIGGGGRDLVRSSVGFDMKSKQAEGMIEDLLLVGAARWGKGNAGGNSILGNAHNNVLDGGAGNDVIYGKTGRDVLIGDLGMDLLIGGSGGDAFRFLDVDHSPVGRRADVITDFDTSGNDRIDLSALFGRKMGYIHDAQFTAAGQVRIKDVAGPDVIVEVNVEGSLAADLHIRLSGTKLAAMTAGDFML